MKYKVLLLLIITLAFLSGCVATKTKYVEILKPDKIFRGGKVEYIVATGDTLEILDSKTCKGGYGICLRVKNVKTGEIGYVLKSRMEDMHHIYVLGESSEIDETKKVKLPSFIEILQKDKIYYESEFQYDVMPGDTLKVLESRLCKDEEVYNTCWLVINEKIGQKGLVNSQKMNDIHRLVYD